MCLAHSFPVVCKCSHLYLKYVSKWVISNTKLTLLLDFECVFFKRSANLECFNTSATKLKTCWMPLISRSKASSRWSCCSSLSLTVSITTRTSHNICSTLRPPAEPWSWLMVSSLFRDASCRARSLSILSLRSLTCPSIWTRAEDEEDFDEGWSEIDEDGCLFEVESEALLAVALPLFDRFWAWSGLGS